MAEISYIDYETFLSPTFSAHGFANTLVTSTNNPSDPTLDLSTPLSRVLFDLQEIDTHIHALTTGSSHVLLSHASTSHASSQRLLSAIESKARTLTAAYQRLESEVVPRSSTATSLTTAITNLHATTTLLRELVRALMLARQLEVQHDQLSTDPSAMVRAAYNIADANALLSARAGALEGVRLVEEVYSDVVQPMEKALAQRCREVIVGFTLVMDTTSFSRDGFAGVGAEGARRPQVTACLKALWLLSREALVRAVEAFLATHVAASVAGLARSLTALTTLDRALADVGARCASVVAMQGYLHAAGLADDVLARLDVKRLSTGFWRNVAAGWEPKVREVVARGGASARILRAGRDKVREGVRASVVKGLGGEEGKCEFEVAVMVGALGSLGR